MKGMAGKGCYGSVYEAVDLQTNTTVAVKISTTRPAMQIGARYAVEEASFLDFIKVHDPRDELYVFFSIDPPIFFFYFGH
jgi:hypothetical protein